MDISDSSGRAGPDTSGSDQRSTAKTEDRPNANANGTRRFEPNNERYLQVFVRQSEEMLMTFAELVRYFTVDERNERLRFHERQEKWNVGLGLISDEHRPIEVLRCAPLSQPLINVGVFA
jgi:hypothetical protein